MISSGRRTPHVATPEGSLAEALKTCLWQLRDHPPQAAGTCRSDAGRWDAQNDRSLLGCHPRLPE